MRISDWEGTASEMNDNAQYVTDKSQGGILFTG
jgi:hypothetical protein